MSQEYAPPPAAPAAEAPAAEEKKSWVKWLILGCGGCLIALLVLGVAIFFVVKKVSAVPEQTVKEFLAAAGSGNAVAAHGYFSEPLKQAQPLEAFTAAVEGQPGLFQVSDTTFSSRVVELQKHEAHFSGTLKLKSGTEVPASFDLVKENGVWKLISYQIGGGEVSDGAQETEEGEESKD